MWNGEERAQYDKFVFLGWVGLVGCMITVSIAMSVYKYNYNKGRGMWGPEIWCSDLSRTRDQRQSLEEDVVSGSWSYQELQHDEGVTASPKS